MSERPIHLNIHSGASPMDLSDPGAQGHHAEPRAADPAAVDQFRAALAEAKAGAAPSATTLAPSPFSLFGAPSLPLASPMTVAKADLDFGAIALTASRMMVSADGRRAVRMEIDASVLPGVTVSVLESGGLLTVIMEAATQDALDRLLHEGRKGADAIATRLQRDVHLELREADVTAPVATWRGQIT